MKALLVHDLIYVSELLMTFDFSHALPYNFLSCRASMITVLLIYASNSSILYATRERQLVHDTENACDSKLTFNVLIFDFLYLIVKFRRELIDFHHLSDSKLKTLKSGELSQ